MKTIMFSLGSLLLWATQATLHAQSGSGGGFGYTINSGGSTITITNYTGVGGAVTVPPTINGLAVTSLGFNAFYAQVNLTSVTISSGVTNIGADAFESCDSLGSVTLPNTVKTIGSFAFSGCARLTSISLGTGLTSIGTEAFSGCEMLTSLALPNSLTNIASYSFYDTGLTNITIPTNVNTIASGVFEECPDLAAITVPASVTNIGASAFEDCDSLTSLYFQGNAPAANSTAFSGETPTAYYVPGTTGWTNFQTNTGLTTGIVPTWTVQVTINPSGAGALWALDNGSLQTSGTTITNVTAASHSLTVRSVSGYQFVNWTSNGVALATTTNLTITITTNLALTANFIPLYTLSLAVSPTNAGTLGGAGTYLPGSTNIVTATPNTGYIFENWSENGVVVSESSNYSLTLNSSESLVANFLPPVSLTTTATPPNGGTVIGGGSNFIAGTPTYLSAAPNSGYVFVSWTGDATGTDNPLSVTVATNLNVIANFAPVLSNISLTLATNGTGSVSVSPKANLQFLKAGGNYTVKAIPAPGSGQIFAGWTGSVTTNTNPLTFSKLQSSVALQANFVTNPFPAFVGTYNGLFSQTNGVITEDTAGMLKGLKLSTNGTYSGTLLVNGKSFAISGAFQADCMATNLIALPAKQGELTVVLTLMEAGAIPQISGMVAGSDWTANLIADRATNSLPSAEFTVLIPADVRNGPPTGSPGGASYALITNDAGTFKNPGSATAKITGALSDGTSFSQSVPVSQDGYVPLYANLYAGKGLLVGWINLDVTNTNAIANTSVAWIRPSGNNFKPYTNGFTNLALTNQILVSAWTNAAASFEALADLTNLSVGGNNLAVSISSAGVITEAAGESVNVVGSINPQTGGLTVTVGRGSGKITGHGAVLLNGALGQGYFLSTNKVSEALQLMR